VIEREFEDAVQDLAAGKQFPGPEKVEDEFTVLSRADRSF
jgi:hypothetical protein